MFGIPSALFYNVLSRKVFFLSKKYGALDWICMVLEIWKGEFLFLLQCVVRLCPHSLGLIMPSQRVLYSQTDRQTGRQTYRQKDRQTDRLTDRQAGREAEIQTARQTDWHTGRQTDRQTDRQADRQTDSQAGRYRQTSSIIIKRNFCTVEIEKRTYARICVGSLDTWFDWKFVLSEMKLVWKY